MLFMRRKSVKTFIRGGMLNFTCLLILLMTITLEKYVLPCNGIDTFVTVKGNFNCGPISRNDIVSSTFLLMRQS